MSSASCFFFRLIQSTGYDRVPQAVGPLRRRASQEPTYPWAWGRVTSDPAPFCPERLAGSYPRRESHRPTAGGESSRPSSPGQRHPAFGKGRDPVVCSSSFAVRPRALSASKPRGLAHQSLCGALPLCLRARALRAVGVSTGEGFHLCRLSGRLPSQELP